MTIESHRAAMQAPIKPESLHRIPNEWDREQADTAPYTAEAALSLTELALISIIAAAVLSICIWAARILWPIVAVLFR